MNNEKMTRQELEQLPDEQLQALLAQVLSSDVPDAELYRLLMEILRERSGQPSSEAADEKMRIWEKYLRDTQGKEKLYLRKKPRRAWKWAAVAAVLVCVLTVAVPTAMGNTQVLDTLGKWRDSVVAFFTGDEPQPEPYTFQTEHSGLQQIYDTVSGYGVTQPIVPTWVPEGYELAEIKTQRYPTKIKMTAVLKREETFIVFTVNIYGAKVPKTVEADDPTVTNVELNGIRHEVTTNEGKWIVKWIRDNTECILSVDSDEETLYAILRSIYKTEAD